MLTWPVSCALDTMLDRSLGSRTHSLRRAAVIPVAMTISTAASALLLALLVAGSVPPPLLSGTRPSSGISFASAQVSQTGNAYPVKCVMSVARARRRSAWWQRPQQ